MIDDLVGDVERHIVEKLLPALRAAIVEQLGEPANGEWTLEIDAGDAQTINFHYPPALPATEYESMAYITPRVKLELGARGDVIVDLHERGALRSLLETDPNVLNTAIALGEEWLGAGSAILKCLRLGVALHHGALPTAYRKEVERLLRENVLKVTISSPTLAQGLNLSATAVVMYSLHRRRADRDQRVRERHRPRRTRVVDVEGIVLFPMFDDIPKKRRNWEALITDLGAREMESGLVRLVAVLLTRMRARSHACSRRMARRSAPC